MLKATVSFTGGSIVSCVSIALAVYAFVALDAMTSDGVGHLSDDPPAAAPADGRFVYDALRSADAQLETRAVARALAFVAECDRSAVDDEPIALSQRPRVITARRPD